MKISGTPGISGSCRKGGTGLLSILALAFSGGLVTAQDAPFPQGSTHPDPGPTSGWTSEWMGNGVSEGSAGMMPWAPRTGILTGMIVEADTKTPITDAEVELPDQGRRTFSDDEGRFSFPFVEPGSVRLQVRRIGYSDAEGLVEVREGEMVEVEVRMATEPIPLEAITVIATRREIVLPGLEDFGRRLKSGRGQFILEDQIRLRSPFQVTDLLHGATGVAVVGNGRAIYMRRTQCPPMVYIDQVKITRCPVGSGPQGEHSCDPFQEAAQAVNLLIPSSILAIEVYRGPGEIPGEYLDSNSRCGVILIWTRRGGEIRRDQ